MYTAVPYVMNSLVGMGECVHKLCVKKSVDELLRMFLFVCSGWSLRGRVDRAEVDSAVGAASDDVHGSARSRSLHSLLQCCRQSLAGRLVRIILTSVQQYPAF